MILFKPPLLSIWIKPRTTKDAVTLTNGMQSHLNFHSQKSYTITAAAVNILVCPSTSYSAMLLFPFSAWGKMQNESEMNEVVYHEKTELADAQQAIVFKNWKTNQRKIKDGVPIEVKASVSEATVVVTPQTAIVLTNPTSELVGPAKQTAFNSQKNAETVIAENKQLKLETWLKSRQWWHYRCATCSWSNISTYNNLCKRKAAAHKIQKVSSISESFFNFCSE